jgi:O-antigen/teichoic acid export membrane protein
VNQIVDIRLWESVTKFVGDYHARGDHGRARATVKLAYLIDAGTGVLAFALVAALSPLAGRLVSGAGAAPYLVLYAATLLVATANDTSMALLRVFDRFRSLSAERVASAVVRLLALWAAAAATGSLGWVLAAYVAVELARGLVLLVLGLGAARAALSTPGPDHLGLLRERFGEFRRFTMNNIGTTVLAAVIRQLDIVILTALHIPREVGLYRMAKNFDVLIHRLSDPIYHAIYPELVRLGAQAPGEIKAFVTRSMRIVLVVVVPAGVFLILAARPILDRLVGPEFGAAALPLRILVAGALIQATFLWARPLALVSGRPQLSTLALAAGAAVLLGASVLLVPRFGAVGSATAQLLTAAVISGITAGGLVRATRPGKATPPAARIPENVSWDSE